MLFYLLYTHMLDKEDLKANSENTPKNTNNLSSEKKELFDIINPYPAGHPCFRLYEKTSEENKMKMRKNININARGNVETMWREFIVLKATPNGKDILEKDWITHFLGDAAQREAEKQWYTLFDTPVQADTFIDKFVWGDNEQNKKIWNMMAILWLYWPKTQTWFYGRLKVGKKKERDRSLSDYKASYAILTKTYKDENNLALTQAYETKEFKYWSMARLQIESDNVTKKIVGEAKLLPNEFWYPAIVSRPIQK